MLSTRPSLLERVKDRADASSWREFEALYSPLIRRYARARGLNPADADDVAQECMGKLVKVMPKFEYDPGRGRFKNYLRSMANHAIESQRRRKRPQAISGGAIGRMPAADDGRAEWEARWEREHLAWCLKKLRGQFPAAHLSAFRLYALEGRPVNEVCERLGLTRNQVYLAKSRITRQLRAAMNDLLSSA